MSRLRMRNLALPLAAVAAVGHRRMWREQLLLVQLGLERQHVGEPGQKKGGTLKVLANSDFDNIDPGIAYYQFSYEFLTSTDKTLYQYKPDDPRQADPGPRRERSEDLGRQEDGHGQDQVRRPVLAAGQPRGHVERRQVRDRARLHQAGRQRLRLGAYFGDLVGAPKTQGDYKPIPGIQTPDKHTIVFKLTKPHGAATLALALVLDGHRAGAQGLRDEVRQDEPVAVRVLSGRHRAVHVPERQVRQDHATSRASTSRWCATRTGRRRPTSGPPTSTRST